jgi:hypothetical protein
MLRPAVLAVCLLAALLAGCDMLGIESPEKLAAARDADGRAVGAACRHAARAIEDCYVLNRRVDKAAIFAGWRDMNDYMRENKIEPVTPVLMAQVAGPAAQAEPRPGTRLDTGSGDKPAAGDDDRAAKGKSVSARDSKATPSS